MPALAQDDGPGPVTAQASADPTAYPKAVTVRRIVDGFRYTTPAGMTLYSFNPREARFRKQTVMGYCLARCAEVFAPYAAPREARPTGLWSIASIGAAPQWLYKGTPVYTFSADRVPGDTGGDGFEDIFNTLAYVPPQPVLTAPAPISAQFDKGRWLLDDGAGHALLVGDCAATCLPLAAGSAALPIGEWTPVAGSDHPQWAWRAKPVFVATSPTVPSGASPIVLGD